MWRLASSMRRRSRSYADWSARSSAATFASPFPGRTCAPVGEESSLRGNTTRSSTNCPLGIPTAWSDATPGCRSTTPCTQAGWP